MLRKIKNTVISSSLMSGIFYTLNRLYLNILKKHQIKKGAKISRSAILEGCNAIGFNSNFISSKIGFGSYIAENSKFHNTKIGSYCSIGPEVLVIRGNHPSSTFVSTHPSFFSLRKHIGFTFSEKQLFEEFPKPLQLNEPYTTVIGNDVWIGARVTILDGVKIGNGAIIAAGALVNKDIPPYTIYGGVPAKFIRQRFTNEQINFLEELKWWQKPLSWLRENHNKFHSIELLMQWFQEQKKHE
jgi:acetyltransferase-like isoleucine patch superfamily enzyme